MIETQLKVLLKEKYPDISVRALKFILEYIRTGDPRQSYISTNTKPVTPGSASALASRILRTYNISMTDFLDMMDHSEFSIVEALNSLKKTDPDKYLNHIEKLRKLDNNRLEIDVRTLPIIEITNAVLST